MAARLNEDILVCIVVTTTEYVDPPRIYHWECTEYHFSSSLCTVGSWRRGHMRLLTYEGMFASIVATRELRLFRILRLSQQ